jgi:hypothetical protein
MGFSAPPGRTSINGGSRGSEGVWLVQNYENSPRGTQTGTEELSGFTASFITEVILGEVTIRAMMLESLRRSSAVGFLGQIPHEY